ncbi:serine hydrolase domain-containing protein [Paenibacillus sp. UNC217MF]|uniref:serine hydrolase domain-containing protein n=1 Tax=Paenibacillus sp. UNC217MF TaxID=1449062 RepID=UPI00055CBF91|nr:serine hydrolase domain-containing protein [Paenibacillus sp. UNC217MF]
MNKPCTQHFAALNEYVERIQHQISATAAATYILHEQEVVNEWYSGTHDRAGQRIVDAASRFNVASVRKTYLGFVVSLALYEGKIRSLDDSITDYIDDDYLDITDQQMAAMLSGTTIRHLLTHTHGLHHSNRRLFSAGTDWAYNNMGVNILIKLMEKLYEKPFVHVLEETVFHPCGFTETGWSKERDDNLVWLHEEYTDDQGNDGDLFVSARELARWGQLHLDKGMYEGTRIIPTEVFELATSICTPPQLETHLPRNGFFWFVQDIPRAASELGDQLPGGSFQSLGITGCACLVIPKYQTVAVRMYNQQGGNPASYDYLEDIKTFGNMVCNMIEKM